MFYLRNGLFDHKFASAISQLFVHKVTETLGHFDFQIAGLETGSTPMLGRVYNLDINAFSVRKEQKKYGLLNWIEGRPNDKPVMIIDDLCNSSMSMKQCYDICKQENLEVLDHAFCLVNKVNKGTHTQLRTQSDMYLPPDIKMIYLFDLDDFNLSSPSH
jgi:orotate phosphoribosyltransferase